MGRGVEVQAHDGSTGPTTGVEGSFRALYPSLRRLASVVADSDVDPDDLVQDAIAGLLSQPMGRVEDPGAYLRRSIVNGGLAHRRRSGRRRLRARRRPPVSESVLEDYPTDVRAVLESVPPRDRALLFLLHVEGRSVDDVASALDLTSGAVKQRALRARQRARHALVAQEEEEP